MLATQHLNAQLYLDNELCQLSESEKVKVNEYIRRPYSSLNFSLCLSVALDFLKIKLAKTNQVSGVYYLETLYKNALTNTDLPSDEVEEYFKSTVYISAYELSKLELLKELYPFCFNQKLKVNSIFENVPR
jgi:hypothetical protein